MHPNDWKIPSWHSDFGDPNQEVGRLREFCIEAIAINKDLKARLVSLEDGYLYVDMSVGGKKIAELYMVDGKDCKRYGLFTFDGDEEIGEDYFSNIGEGIELLRAS